MAGKRIVIPNYMPALDLTGAPVAGAKIYFYENETTDLKSVYTSAALTTAHPNPVVANAAGVFPSIFADDAEEFTVAITDANGSPIAGLRNRDNISPSLAFLEGVELAASAAVGSILGENTLDDFTAAQKFLQSGTGAVERGLRDKLRDTISALDFGAVADGTTDDTTALTAAIVYASAAGLPLVLGPKHRVTSAVPIAGSVVIRGPSGGRCVMSTTATNHAMFSFSGTDLTLSGMSADGEYSLLQIANDTTFGTVEVTDVKFAGRANNVNLFLFAEDNDRSVTGDKINIHHCELSYCTAAFIDETLIEDLLVDDNRMDHMIRHVVRALDTTDPADPDDHHTPAYFSFQRNKVYGINDDWPDKAGQAARMCQVSPRKLQRVLDNEIRDILPSGATGTGLYFEFGSVEFGRNRVTRFQSNGSTGERFISDKSNGGTGGDYYFKSYDNVFDQRDVAIADAPASMMHFFAMSNVECNNDTFIGLRCYGYEVWQSVTPELGATTPSNYLFRGAKFYDHKYPTCFNLMGQCADISIEGCKVFGISNPDTAVPQASDSTRLRLVDMYATSTAVADIDGVNITDNEMYGSSANMVLALAYRHASATYDIKHWTLARNFLETGAGWIRVVSGGTIGSGGVIRDNNGAPSARAVGVIPAGTEMSNNAPRGTAIVGNAAATLTAGVSKPAQIWSTALTADRAVTLSTTNAVLGDSFRITRASAATGAFNLNVGSGPLKALAAGSYCDVSFDGSAWLLTGYGTL